MPSVISYKAFDWIIDIDSDSSETIIYSCGKTLNGETVMVRIEGFCPYVYMELPSNRKWTPAAARDLYDSIVEVFVEDNGEDSAPIGYKLCRKFMIEYLRPSTHLMLIFKSHGLCKLLEYKCKRKIGAYAPNTFKVHEQNIDPLIKFFTLRKITPCGWIDVIEDSSEETLQKSGEEFATTDIQITVKWDTVNPSNIPSDTQVPMRVASFDIECYSKNHNSKHPDATIAENIVFQISLHIMDYATKKLTRNLLSMYDCLPIEDTNVIQCETEKDLILKFSKLVMDIDPDIFISWNGVKFDWDYLIQRAEHNEIYIPFSKLGRLTGQRALLETKKWNSKAYGEQNYRFIHPQGRINIDMMVEIERAYKLDKYSLDFVANRFLGEHKEEVSPLQLFKLVEITQKYKSLSTHVTIDKVKSMVSSLISKDMNKGVVKRVFDAVLKASTIDEVSSAISLCIYLVGSYCVKDSILPIRLFEYHNTYNTLEQMSNIYGVPITYLQTRGQQIKVMAQLYRETTFNNIVVTYKAYGNSASDNDTKYQGAVVIDAIPGYYENVVVFDFESLYPTTIISKNICYTTLIHPDDTIPDDRCNVCEWSDHVGCEHDPKRRKKKEEHVLCDGTSTKKYRFTKVTYDKDGTPHGEGVMPRLLRRLLSSRKEVKAEIKVINKEIETLKTLDGNKTRITELKTKLGVLDAKQKALKVSANSAYGFMGARVGMLPLIAGASSTTAIGRELIMAAIKYIKTMHKSLSLIYGDTDSCMWEVRVKGSPKDPSGLEEVFTLAKTISKQTTTYLKRKLLGIEEASSLTVKQQIEYDATPINLEFENVYKKYLLLTMKRYIGYTCDITGKITGSVSKGVVSVRRDNCNYSRSVYNQTVEDIFAGLTKEEVMGRLYDRLHDVVRGVVSPKLLSIFVGIGDVHKESSTDKKKHTYTKESHSVHVMLARRMIARGDDVVPNTRLEYVLLKTDSGALQGDKAEDYTYFMDNRRTKNLKIDYLYYLEKKFNQLNELITVKFPPKVEIYEPLERRIDAKILEIDDEEEKDAIVKLNTIERKINYILRSSSYEGDRYIELVELCKRWKAETFMIRLYKQYGIQKPIERRKPGKEVIYDSVPIDSLYKVHKSYRQVVEELNSAFSPFT